jgi:hypothetical protein
MDGVPAVAIFFNSSKYGTQLPGWFYTAFVFAIIAFEAQAMGSDDNSTTTKRQQWDLNQSVNAIQLKERQDTELAFGRIGMIGAIGMIAQELVTDAPILSTLGA